MTVVAETILIENGMGTNAYLLDINRALSSTVRLTAPWNLPSRLFQFPVEVAKADGEGQRQIGMMHPALSEHPFIQHVEKIIGAPLSPEGAPNEYGVSNQPTAQWWHAVDLISAGLWRELIQTQHFTTPALIAQAVAFGLDHRSETRPGMTTADARVVMLALDFAEPDAVAHLCEVMEKPQLHTHSNGKSWSVRANHGTRGAAKTWGLILGLELGWFVYDRSGFLAWTQKGRDRFEAGNADTFTESATGQIAFAF
jgi:hypothetical protein